MEMEMRFRLQKKNAVRCVILFKNPFLLILYEIKKYFRNKIDKNKFKLIQNFNKI
jgi:hypothetical protein